MNRKQWVYHFRVMLDMGSEKKDKGKVWREIEVLSSQSLSTLARIIVKSFGFYFDHCFGFYDNFNNPYRSKEIYELFTDIGEEPTEGAFGVEHVKVSKAFNKPGKKLRFLFDYGDDWQFAVELLGIELTDGGKYPRIVKVFGKAPVQYPNYD